MWQKAKMILLNNNPFIPEPERVLVTSFCRDAYTDNAYLEKPSSLAPNGFQDGFGEYSTNLPEKYKFYTNQSCYGLSFLESNVKGPTQGYVKFRPKILNR